MNKEMISRFIFMYLLVLVIIVTIQYMFLDGINILNSLLMPLVIAFLTLGFRSNVKKDEEIAARKNQNTPRK